jgi:transposase
MSGKKSSRNKRTIRAGQRAEVNDHTLRSYQVGAVPIINRLIERLQLDQFLRQHLRSDGPRTRLPTARGLLLAVRNLLMSRQPIYGIGEWAQQFAPDLLGLTLAHLQYLNDDRLGRCLDRLFEANQGDLVMAVVRHAVKEFDLRLDELHNDSTTVSFFGAYEEASDEGEQRGKRTRAITYGHSKDHRPDLKQLLYTLTVTDDGGVPVYFTTHNGNTVDDQTHRETWDLLCELVGRRDFLYVADCKLATADNMKYIHRKGGRFISVLPASRKEDRRFRKRMEEDPDSITWAPLFDVVDDKGDTIDRLWVCPEEHLTKEKCRLWWFRSTRKAQNDDRRRLEAIRRAVVNLTTLRDRLVGPRPRLRTTEQVEPLVEEILRQTETQPLLQVEVRQFEAESYRQTSRGRPGKNTKYRKETQPLCDLTWEVNTAAITQCQASDGVFPLITNARDMTAEQVLRAYKRQPIIEKRFSQLKTDFEVAPVYLKNVSRIQALFCLYFFALLLQTLLERELRTAMFNDGLDTLPLYPEGRPCKAPTARRVIDVFDNVQRHSLTRDRQSMTFGSELTNLQRHLLELLGMSCDNYGR